MRLTVKLLFTAIAASGISALAQPQSGSARCSSPVRAASKLTFATTSADTVPLGGSGYMQSV
jgi:hypothetical protein